MKLLNKLVKLTSDIYIAPKPLFILYKPECHKVKGFEIRKIINNLKYGDILLRRFDGYLNTILTPGFWGHSAVYINDNEILHSVAAGTVQEDILDFCRADSVCVLRYKKFNRELFTEKVIEIKNNHIDYDYEFERYDDQFYCTELINYLYDGLFDDSFEESFGKSVLLPDNIRYHRKLEMILEFIH